MDASDNKVTLVNFHINVNCFCCSVAKALAYGRWDITLVYYCRAQNQSQVTFPLYENSSIASIPFK